LLLARIARSSIDAKSWPDMLAVAMAPNFGCSNCSANSAPRILRLIGWRIVLDQKPGFGLGS
jgi:hypothetical protein